MPTTPYIGATWEPTIRLLQALWDGKDPRQALQLAQQESQANIEKSRRQ
jgi:maltose-binding protein MalE